MPHADDAAAAAAELLAQPVLAAAVFGPVDGAASAAGIHVAREVRAESPGLEVRMVLVVTAADYHLLDWVGGRCTCELARFPRASTHVQISRFGLSRRVRLDDPAAGTSVDLDGPVSPISGESRADEAVLALLAGEAA